jgi:hypothetical protein
MSDRRFEGRSPAVGLRQDWHQYPQGQKGGISYYPVTLVSNPTIDALSNTLTVVLKAGQVRLDGTAVTIAANQTIARVPGVDMTAALDQTLYLYLNCTRLIPAVTALPGTPALGNKILLCARSNGKNSGGPYHTVEEYLMYNGTNWIPFSPMQEKVTHGHNNMPMNEVIPVVTVANFQLEPELPVYNQSGMPTYNDQQGAAWLRQSASILLATVTVNADTLVSAESYLDESYLPV